MSDWGTSRGCQQLPADLPVRNPNQPCRAALWVCPWRSPFPIPGQSRWCTEQSQPIKQAPNYKERSFLQSRRVSVYLRQSLIATGCSSGLAVLLTFKYPKMRYSMFPFIPLARNNKFVSWVVWHWWPHWRQSLPFILPGFYEKAQLKEALHFAFVLFQIYSISNRLLAVSWWLQESLISKRSSKTSSSMWEAEHSDGLGECKAFTKARIMFQQRT